MRTNAPDFTLTDASGRQVTLSSFRGKNVVLEWFNPGCPFVKKFYSGGEMQKLQQKVVAGGDVWLTISSSASGKQGHISQDAAAEVVAEQRLNSTALLLDDAGAVGKQYGARTTPHMFVVDAKGELAYAGAIDSVRSTDPDDISGATNYVMTAIDELKGGKQVTTAATEPYGCSVKY
jgi:peroxiredoxin